MKIRGMWLPILVCLIFWVVLVKCLTGCQREKAEVVSDEGKTIEITRMEEPLAIKFYEPTYLCPICGKTDESFFVYLGEEEYIFCGRCWINWMIKNIPQLELVEPEEKDDLGYIEDPVQAEAESVMNIE